MSSLVRLSQICLIEFGEKFTKSIFQHELYAYRFGKNIQLLNEDGSINDRDKSYCPYYQNILLKRTPYPYFNDTFHNSSKLSTNVSSTCPAIEYQRATINFASGYFYSSNTYLSALRLYYIIDGTIDFTVAAIIDERTSSRLKANKRNIVLDNTIFNASIDIDFLNVSQLFNSNDEDIIALKEKLFGTGSHTCSELFIEQFIVDNSQIMDFVDMYNHPFKRFFIEDINKSYYTKQDLSDELFASFKKDITNTCLTMQLLHTKYDVQQYLEQKLTSEDTWSIKYELTTTAYNFDGDVIGSNSIKLENPSSPFTEVIYRPIILDSWMNPESGFEVDKIDHALFDLRCIATTGLAQLEITRYAKMTEVNPESYYIPSPQFNIIAPKVYSKKDVITHEVKMQTDLPNIIKINKPYYVFTSIADAITLNPYNTNIGIDISSYDTSLSKTFKLRLGSSEYSSSNIQNKKVIFSIPSTEYTKDTKTYYLCDSEGNVITYGSINRI